MLIVKAFKPSNVRVTTFGHKHIRYSLPPGKNGSMEVFDEHEDICRSYPNLYVVDKKDGDPKDALAQRKAIEAQIAPAKKSQAPSQPPQTQNAPKPPAEAPKAPEAPATAPQAAPQAPQPPAEA